MFKHVASENGPLVLILQSYSQIFIVLKHIDQNLVELIWTSKICESSLGDGGTSALFPWYGIIRWHPPTRGYQRNLHFYGSIDPL